MEMVTKRNFDWLARSTQVFLSLLGVLFMGKYLVSVNSKISTGPCGRARTISTYSNNYIVQVQFPLSLAYACTVHKVQGLTLPNVVFSFILEKQRNFNSGQIYVAISRVRALTNLYISGNVDQKEVRANRHALDEYDRLRTEANFFDKDLKPTAATNFQICVFNTRSLNKHAVDIAKDNVIMQSNLICLTETQRSHGDCTESIQAHFPNFVLSVSNNNDKYCSLAVLYDSDLLSHQSFNGLYLSTFFATNDC